MLYWMQAAQRAWWNPALEYAVMQANDHRVPVVACFCLSPGYPSATGDHYRFMLEGLRETKADLGTRGIDLVVGTGHPPDLVARLGADACLVVADGGHTRIQRRWRDEASRALTCRLVEVESTLVVPIDAAYDRQAYSAAVLRPRIRGILPAYLVPWTPIEPTRGSRGSAGAGIDIEDIDGVLASLGLPARPEALARVTGGRSHAHRRLEAFLATGLASYEDARRDPAEDGTSRLSAYLHFGQIASVEVAVRAREAAGSSADAFLEELIVRRELAHNYAWFNPQYDRYEGIPAWARQSLGRHRQDPRPFLYDFQTLEAGTTHDPYWNAAQWEMRLTGWMHGYMRMYWGKKLIEWSASPEEAYARAVALNDRYELDGRDPNGYAGIAWCFGAHDRPLMERPVFGTVRSMSATGLRRTFDVDAYVRRVEALIRQTQAREPRAGEGDDVGGPS